MAEVSTIVNNPIVIPEGKFRAPGDYRITSVALNLNGTPRNIDLIKQTFSGNCAEYTTLNTVLIAQAAGLVVNPDITTYLAKNPSLNLNTLENDFVIPFLLNAQEKHPELPSTADDVMNLVTKSSNSYESLTNQNSVLLFRDALSSIDTKFERGEQIKTQADIENMQLNYLSAIFMGSNDHATSMLKLGDQYVHIDPYFNQNVAKILSEQDALALLRRTMIQSGSIIITNPLSVK